MSANNPIIRKVNLTGLFQPLAAEPAIGRFTFRVPSDASGAVALLGDDRTTEVPLARGQQFTLDGVDLAEIEAKGSLGDYLVVIGSSRTIAQ